MRHSTTRRLYLMTAVSALLEIAMEWATTNVHASGSGTGVARTGSNWM
jgi:hypothetical protein